MKAESVELKSETLDTMMNDYNAWYLFKDGGAVYLETGSRRWC